MASLLESFKISFVGTGRDAYGMSNPYHVYLVFVSPAPCLGSQASVATIITITGSPLPVQRHFPKMNGTPGGAEAGDIQALKQLHPGLKMFEQES
jgi:hypothetical protein